MRFTLNLAAVICIAIATSALAKPDPEFTRVAEQWIKSHVETTLAETVRATGEQPTNGQINAAYCRAIAAWKSVNPGGEKKLTLESLARMRVFIEKCPSLKDVPLGEDAKNAPPAGAVPLPDNIDELEQEAMDKAIKDFIAWHPDEFDDAETAEEYAKRQLLVWWYSDEYAELLRRYGRDRGGYIEVDPEFVKAEQEFIGEAKRRWLAAHPDPNAGNAMTPGSEKSRKTRADGAIVTEYTNGVVAIDHPDGREETVFPDGRREIRYPDGRRETFNPDGSIEVVTGIGAGRRTTLTQPDGTTDVWTGQNADEYIGGFIPGLGTVTVRGAVHPDAGKAADGGKLEGILAGAVKKAEEDKGRNLTALEEWEARRGALRQWEAEHPEGKRTGEEESAHRTAAARLREDEAVMEMRRRMKSREDGTVDPLDGPGWRAAVRAGRDIADGSVDPLDGFAPEDTTGNAGNPPPEAPEQETIIRNIDLGARAAGQIHTFQFAGVNESCEEPQDFRFDAVDTDWMRFPGGNVTEDIPMGGSRSIAAQIDARNLAPGRYQGIVEVTCETCGWFVFADCFIDKQELRLQVQIVPPN